VPVRREDAMKVRRRRCELRLNLPLNRAIEPAKVGI